MDIKRRQFIQASTAIVALGMTDGALLLSGNQSANAATASKNVRRDVTANVAGLDQVAAYERAVRLMKDREPNDPLSWESQAQIHQNHCPHGNWWFLPWHRAYLFHFESICQKVLSDPSFRLPYWNWTKDRSVPAAFWDERTSLFQPNREISPNDEVEGDVTGRTLINRIMNNNVDVLLYSGATRTDDQREPASQGELESTPHNGIHVFVGGEMGSFLSPRDPIFWLHHANVDRLWRSWSELHQHRSIGDKLWKDHKLTEFFDADGKVVTHVTSTTEDFAKFNAEYDVLETVVSTSTKRPMEPLSFTTKGLAGRQLVAFSSDVGDLGIAGSMQLAIDTPIKNSISKATAPLLAAEEKPIDSVILMKIEGITVKNTETRLRVFINCDKPSPNTPIGSPSFVATINFFGVGHGDHGGDGVNFIFDCTSTFAKLKKSGLYNGTGDIKVSFVPIGRKNAKEPSVLDDVKPKRVTFVGL
ncbi:tyrosinase family protein [Pseudomonas sp. PLMAX]|uniref:tyrosinase family protein n=1 Tax=Pseudomonas sp. PLMAX TaxID=2201998 RepID=UPI0038BB5319